LEKLLFLFKSYITNYFWLYLTFAKTQLGLSSVEEEEGEEDQEGENLLHDSVGTQSTNSSIQQKGSRSDYVLSSKLLSMGKHKTIEKIYDSDNMDLVNYFVTRCVSYSTGKRKWNKYSYQRPISDFVTYSDEAFAMMVIENNAEKWIAMHLNPKLKKHELPKAPYTEGVKGNKWTMKGLLRFLELSKICLKRRQAVTNEAKKRIQDIEQEVLRREMDLREGLCRNNAKRKLESDWENYEIEDGETSTKKQKKLEEEKNMENLLVALANGTMEQQMEDQQSCFNDSDLDLNQGFM
jgi:hypothetical protein